MKKIISILVLGFLWSGSAYAKNVTLMCEHTKGESLKVLIINDNTRSLKVEDVPGLNSSLKINNYSNEQIEGYNEDILNGKLVQRMTYNLDRRTGMLTLRTLFANGNIYYNNYKCELFKKNKF
jgi:hypothetical protein